MLVLTRRVNEKIAFPSLGITIQILKLSGSAARVGIDAPPEITILRDELPDRTESGPNGGDAAGRHARANAISKVTLAIHLARKQWEQGLTEQANRTLEKALEYLEALDQRPRVEPVRRLRALIVEDDDNERELLAGLLGMHGCECVTAPDGEEALAYLKNGLRPDVVLLDMAMPVCNGPETLRRIRTDAELADLRVFSVSSTSPSELNLPEGVNGFDAWFPKPLNPQRLWEAIRASGRVTAN